MNFQEFMNSALTEAGLSDEQVTGALAKIYSNEKLSPKLNNLVKTATEDYQAQVGRVKQYQDWYPKAQAEYDRMATETARVTAELESLKSGGGNQQQPQFDASNYITKADLQAMQLDMGRRYAGVIKDSNRITARHVARFKEEPDLDAIDRLATEQNLPLNAAYDKWIEPRVKEQESQAKKEWEKSTRDEIERDLRSRYKLPTETVPAETAPLYRKNTEAPKDMDAELLEAWHSAPAKV
jgi:hypothetical protein